MRSLLAAVCAVVLPYDEAACSQTRLNGQLLQLYRDGFGGKSPDWICSTAPLMRACASIPNVPMSDDASTSRDWPVSIATRRSCQQTHRAPQATGEGVRVSEG